MSTAAAAEPNIKAPAIDNSRLDFVVGDMLGSTVNEWQKGFAALALFDSNLDLDTIILLEDGVANDNFNIKELQILAA